MRAVLDVNVWISALLWRGVPGEIVDLVKNQRSYHICFSNTVGGIGIYIEAC